jgi:hypothetical protein
MAVLKLFCKNKILADIVWRIKFCRDQGKMNFLGKKIAPKLENFGAKGIL